MQKIAEKRGKRKDITAIRKLVSAKARKLHVDPRLALVLIAKNEKIGTARIEKDLNDSQQSQLHRLLSPAAAAQPTTRSSSSKKTILRTNKKIVEIIDYGTNDHFKKGHIAELNKAYTHGCYTSVFILARKIVESLVIDILKAQFPENKKENKELYFDTNQGRFKDFDVILKNLKGKKGDFGSENKAVDRLYGLAKSLKDDANDKTHSWYHLVEKRQEIDNLNLKAIIEIIKKLEGVVGLR